MLLRELRNQVLPELPGFWVANIYRCHCEAAGKLFKLLEKSLKQPKQSHKY
jgi:hypothetical protein